jgi:hypothetical protein
VELSLHHKYTQSAGKMETDLDSFSRLRAKAWRPDGSDGFSSKPPIHARDEMVFEEVPSDPSVLPNPSAKHFLEPPLFNRFFRTPRASVQPFLNLARHKRVGHARALDLNREMRRRPRRAVVLAEGLQSQHRSLVDGFCPDFYRVPNARGVLERDSARLPISHGRQDIIFAFYSPMTNTR